MKITEIVTSTDQQRLTALKRNAASAKQAERQERYRQAMLKYRERMRTRQPGAPAPEAPKPPEPIKPLQ